MDDGPDGTTATQIPEDSGGDDCDRRAGAVAGISHETVTDGGHRQGDEGRADEQAAERTPASGRESVEETTWLTDYRALPFKRGGLLGGLATLLPYLVTTGLMLVVHEDPITIDGQEVDATGVAAELFLGVGEFTAAEELLGLFLASADVDLTAVDPSDYPTVESELSWVLSILLEQPTVLLVAIYLVVPYLLFAAGRSVARRHTPGDRLLDHVAAGATVAIGAVPVVFVAGLVGVTGLADRLLWVGLITPVAFGGLAGGFVWAFAASDLRRGAVAGWIAAGAGVLLAMMLVPAAVDFPGDVALGLGDRLVLGVVGFLSATQFETGTGGQLTLLLLVTLGLIAATGFWRAWQRRHQLADPAAGARVGASVTAGLVWTLAVLAALLPLVIVLVEPVGTVEFAQFERGLVAELELSVVDLIGSLSAYRSGLMFGGLLVPLAAGGAGGYLAVWYRDRNATPDEPRG